jgi:hypothetical protein
MSTAFQIVDVDPDADPRSIRTRATVRRRRIAHAADRFPVFGRTLTVAEINEAEEQLTAPRDRLLNELLTHRPETGDVDAAELADLLGVLEDAGFFAPAGAGEQNRPSSTALDRDVLLSLLPDPGKQSFAPLWTEDGER